MDDLTTYRLEHLFPFSRDVYLRLFELHNEMLWPCQILAAAVGLAVLWRAAKGDGRATGLLMALGWLFVAATFFFDRYATLLWVAPYIGGAFVLEAVLLGVGGFRGWLDAPEDRTSWTRLGLGIAAAGMLLFPLIAPLTGRGWTAGQMFGTTPDPTVLVTLGLVLASRRTRWFLLFVPLGWCAIAAATALVMEHPAGFVLPAAGAATVVLAVGRALTHDS